MTTLQVSAPVSYSRIISLGVERGNRVVPNDDIVGPIDSSDEWIRQRTGIVTRRFADESQTVVSMGVGAAQQALERAGLTGADIDTVIVATVTHFHQTPAAATIIADTIGATPAPAYDISAGCAGFCYALGQADALVRSGTARHVLIVGVEKMSEFIDPTDRSISFILGDGAGAVIVGPSDTPGIGPTVWGSDGSKAHTIDQTASWLDAIDQDLPRPSLRQEGPTVFKWASFAMAPVAKEAIAAAGLAPADLNAFIPHQANMRIIDQMIKQLGLPETVKVGRDIADQGNTSAASIPLAMERMYAEGELASGDLALLIGFGAGLAYASQVVVVP